MLYELVEKGTDSPIELEELKDYLRIPQSLTAEDKMLEVWMDAAIEFAEKYTGRDLRCHTWKLFLDGFEARTTLKRSPVDKVLSIDYLVSGTESTVASSVYYLKKGYQWSEVLLADEQEWPDDGDDGVEHNVRIKFKTKAFASDTIKLGLLLHIANMYENRGDCSVEDAARDSGAKSYYDQYRIDRV